MAKTSTNRSHRPNTTVKALRRAPLPRDEADDGNPVAGASGDAAPKPRRPGRAAALRTSTQRTRSQRWRSVAAGKVKRRSNPAERAQNIRSPRTRE